MNIKLVKGSDGRFILNKEAVNVLRKAKEIEVSYNRSIPSDCYVKASLSKDLYGENFLMEWLMPINVLEQQYRFKSRIVNHAKHPLQMLIKKECELIFIPSSEGQQDTIRFMINQNGKVINGIFDQRVMSIESNFRIVTLL